MEYKIYPQGNFCPLLGKMIDLSPLIQCTKASIDLVFSAYYEVSLYCQVRFIGDYTLFFLSIAQ